MRKTFLFLQGPATDFFAHLAQALAARGHKAASISFCAGDALLCRGAGPPFCLSRPPRDPAWYLRVAPKLPEVDSPAPLPNPIWRLAAWEVAYKLPGLLNPLLSTLAIARTSP